MKGRAGGVRRSPRRRKRSVTSKLYPRALYIRTSLWARKSPACPAVRSPSANRNASEKQRNLRCEPSCKARWSSAPTIPAPLTAHHHPSFRQDGCPLHLRFHRQGPRRQGADPCQGVQGLRRRQGVRVRQQVQGEFPRLTSFAGVDINKWRASRSRGLCPFASVESAMPGSQSKRTKRIHWKSPELASSALAVASRAGDPRRARR